MKVGLEVVLKVLIDIYHISPFCFLKYVFTHIKSYYRYLILLFRKNGPPLRNAGPSCLISFAVLLQSLPFVGALMSTLTIMTLQKSNFKSFNILQMTFIHQLLFAMKIRS